MIGQGFGLTSLLVVKVLMAVPAAVWNGSTGSARKRLAPPFIA
jgi:hypothetical protein